MSNETTTVPDEVVTPDPLSDSVTEIGLVHVNAAIDPNYEEGSDSNGS